MSIDSIGSATTGLRGNSLGQEDIMKNLLTPVSNTPLPPNQTSHDLVCSLLLE